MSKPTAPIRTHTAGDLVVLAAIAGLVVFYCVDAIRASTDVLNLILVLPLSVAVLALCLVQCLITVGEVRARGPASGSRQARADGAPKTVRPGASPLADGLRVVGLFAFYVLSLPWLGFDIGTCLFLAAFLWLHGERRLPRLAGFSIGFAFLLAFFFSRMLPYPMPMLLLGAQ